MNNLIITNEKKEEDIYDFKKEKKNPLKLCVDSLRCFIGMLTLIFDVL